jgi:phosphoglycolate phosphatase
MPLTGFPIRGWELVVYLVVEGAEGRALLSKLGQHKLGKSCLYFKQLADLDKSTPQAPPQLICLRPMRQTVLLFDLDGTLTDPRPGIVGSMRYALERLGVACPNDSVLAGFIGPPLRATFATLLETTEPTRIEEAMRAYRERFVTVGMYENRVYDGVPAMLETAGQIAAATFVATSKPAIYAQQIVKHFGLGEYFQRVYGPELDGKYEDKSELLAHLLAVENVVPENAVMVGDREADIVAAKRNRIRSIGVLWGYGSEQELFEAGADVICRTPQNLSQHLLALAGRGRR